MSVMDLFYKLFGGISSEAKEEIKIAKDELPEDTPKIVGYRNILPGVNLIQYWLKRENGKKKYVIGPALLYSAWWVRFIRKQRPEFKGWAALGRKPLVESLILDKADKEGFDKWGIKIGQIVGDEFYVSFGFTADNGYIWRKGGLVYVGVEKAMDMWRRGY